MRCKYPGTTNEYIGFVTKYAPPPDALLREEGAAFRAAKHYAPRIRHPQIGNLSGRIVDHAARRTRYFNGLLELELSETYSMTLAS